ncbi:MAG: sialate O-acetylesterase [Clostridiales bacterium]|nr:sialate O-acetylesterase [Clostridiales bacterium]
MKLKRLTALFAAAAFGASLSGAPALAQEEWTKLHTFDFEAQAWSLSGDNASSLGNTDALYPDLQSGEDSLRFIYRNDDTSPLSNMSVTDDMVKSIGNSGGKAAPSGKILASGTPTNKGGARSIEVYRVPETEAGGDTTKLKLSFDFALHDLGTVRKKVPSYAVKLTSTDGGQYCPIMTNAETALTGKNIYSYDGKSQTVYSGTTIDYENWYNIEIIADFYNGIVETYLDGVQIANSQALPVKFTLDNLKSITLEQTQTEWSDDYIFYDNVSLFSSTVAKEPDSVVTTTLSRTPSDAAVTVGTELQYTASVTDSLDREINSVEFYLNDTLVFTDTEAPYEYTLNALEQGEYTVKAVAENSNGNTGEASDKVLVSTFLTDYIYSDNMIFQRGKPIVIKGSGKSGEVITASFNGTAASCTAEHGKWAITLPAQNALKSADLVLTGSGGGVITLKNVAVGDVILCAGQSNMNRTFSAFSQLRSERDKDYEDLRLFITEDTSGWKTATVDGSYYFSALGYMIGKRVLNENPDVPVGVVRASFDGSAITAWTGNYAFNWDADMRSMFAGAKSSQSTYFYSRISPVRDMSFAAAVWYQGEGNTWYVNNNYEKAMVSLINNWREVFGDENLPFVVVQLPTANFAKIYNSGRIGVGVRAGQWNVSERLDNVKTVVSIDTGNTNDVHPQDKQPIADRAAAFVSDFINETDSQIDSPSFAGMTREGDTLVLRFKNTGGALSTTDGEAPRGFEIRDDNGVYSDAQVNISGDKIEINVTGIENPQVRYAWSDTPGVDRALVETQTAAPAAVNLVNVKSLPMAPFKTDERENYFYTDLTKKTDCYKFIPYITQMDADENGKITIRAYDTDGTVESVQVYVDDTLCGQAQKSGDIWTFAPDTEPGVHTMYAVVTDNDGLTSLANDGATYTVTRPAHKDYVNTSYKTVTSSAAFDNGAKLMSAASVDADGENTTAAAAVPAGETSQSLRLGAATGGKSVNAVLPVLDAQNPQSNVTISFDMMFEGGDSAIRAARGVNAVTKDGKEIPLLYVTLTSMRFCGNYYEIKPGIENNRWYNVKISINPNAGTFSMWLDDVLQYDNYNYVYEAKDYEKNKYLFDRLKEGITAVKLYHASSANNEGIENATYFDNLTVTESAYVLGDAPVVTDYKITDVNAGDKVTVSIQIPDTQNPNAVLYLAAYDADGRLISVYKTTPAKIREFEAVSGAAKYKAFVWEDMKALCAAF